MRDEPIEIGMVGIAARKEGGRRRAMSQTFKRTRTAKENDAVATAAVDEAFAITESRPTHWTLIKNLSAQLEALDRQREQLAQLLHSIDADMLDMSRD